MPTTIKLYHAPANAHLLRSPTRLVGAGIAGIGTVVITIVVFGFDTFRTYLRILRRWYTRRDDPFSATLAGGPYEPMMLFGNERFIVQSALILITFAVSLISLRQPGETTDRYVYVLGIATVGFAVPGVKMYTLVILLPALVVSLHTEWIDDGVPEIPILSLILIHGHRHSMIVGHELAERAGLLTAFETVYPVVQPALWGVALLYGLALWRLLQLTGVIPGRAPDIGNI